MSTTIPAPELRAPVSAAAAPVTIPATVPNPPPPLLALAIGSLVTGTVISQEEPGHFLVRSEQGIIPLTTRAPLTVDAQVTLQIRTRGTQIHVTITQINGQAAHLRPLPQPSQQPPNTAAETANSRTEASQPSPLQPDRVLLTPGAAARLSSPSSTAPTTPPAITVGTLDAPARVAQLLAQVPPRIGLVVASPDGGQLRVQTSLGTFGLATNAAIAPGTSVRILVQSAGPPVRIALEPTADGRLRDTPAQRQIEFQARSGAVPAGGQAPVAPTPGGPERGDVLALGQRLRATVQAPGGGSSIQPVAIGGPEARAGISLPIGANLDVRLQPAGSVKPTALAQPSQTTAQPPAPLQHAGAGQRSPPGPGLSAGSDPPGPSGTRTSPASLPQVSGVVVGTSGQGRPLLQTPLGLLAIQVQTPLPVGAQFTVELLSPHQSPLVLGARAEPIPLTQSWPSLEAALGLLAETVAAGGLTAGAASPTGQVPQPGPKLASTVLFFLSALTGGDASSWLQTLLPNRGREAIEGQGRGDLLARIMQDFAQLGRLTDLAGPDWRFVPIPLFDGQQLQQLRLFLRKRRKRPEGGKDEAAGATRFIVEVELSQLGDLQLDGLIKQKRFDLMLRTRRALPSTMRLKIAEIFESANAAAGYLGNVGFQASADWVPMPLADPETANRSLVI